MVFDEDERGPNDNLRLHFEAVAQISAQDQQVIRLLLESIILKHNNKRFVRNDER